MKKNDKACEILADTIITAITDISSAGDKAAKYDKSFSVTILGVNRKFTDSIPAADRRELISKYGIPEATDEGEPVCYTFKINDDYYVKKSAAVFLLYESVTVRVPNGDWDNMYIENNKSAGGGGEDNAKVIVSATTPTAQTHEFGVGDYWIKTRTPEGKISYAYAIALYQYKIPENSQDNTPNWLFLCNYRKPFMVAANLLTGQYNYGDIWLKLDPDTDTATDVREYSVFGWRTLFSFNNVGRSVKTTNAQNTSDISEKFGDYDNNAVTGAFNHVEGENNKLLNVNAGSSVAYAVKSPRSTHIQGSGNTVRGGYYNHIEGCDNTVITEPDALELDGGAINIEAYNHVEGTGNELRSSKNIYNNAPLGNHVGGHSNTLYAGQDMFVYGAFNTVGTAGGGDRNQMSAVLGDHNTVTGGSYGSLVSGRYNTVGGGVSSENKHNLYGSAVFGIGNSVSGRLERSFVSGTGHAEHGSNRTTIGRYSEWVNGALFTVGNGSGENNRNNAFYVTDNGYVYVGSKLFINGVEAAQTVKTKTIQGTGTRARNITFSETPSVILCAGGTMANGTVQWFPYRPASTGYIFGMISNGGTVTMFSVSASYNFTTNTLTVTGNSDYILNAEGYIAVFTYI